MRLQIANSIYGLLDYAAYPLGMLALAPIVLKHLGVAQYSIWAVTTAVVSFCSIIASGFGDANIQQVASRRGAGDLDALLRVVRATMGIHLLLGSMMAVILWIAAPALAARCLANSAHDQPGLVCIRIAGAITLVRALETVCMSTQRAFERYGEAIKISVLVRLLSLAAAAVISIFDGRVTHIMTASVLLAFLGLIAQFIQLGLLLNLKALVPSFDATATRQLMRFGIFTWLLATTGVVFSQADKLFAGASMGASAVVCYALCAQLSQPVYGLTAASLHFLFPHFAARRSTSAPAALRQGLLVASLVNLLLVAAAAACLLAFSARLFHILATDDIARQCTRLLPSVLAGSALLALGVSSTYAMLALGRVVSVAVINIAAALALLLVNAAFLPSFGINAIVAARLVFAMIASLIWIPLLRELRSDEFRRECRTSFPHKTAAEEA